MIAMTALDIPTVQAFLLVAELESFTRAAEALGTTQAVGQAEIALRGRFYGAKPELLKENLKTYVKNTYDSEVINRAEVS